MNTLYNKIPYFKKINQGSPKKRGRNRVRKQDKENEEKDKQPKNQYQIFKHITRFALGVKNISVNYSENKGTFLPGYLNEPHFLGQDWSQASPGIPFVFGSQKDIRYIAANNGWITKDTLLNSLYKKDVATALTLRSTIEPIKQFRIELTATRNYSNCLLYTSPSPRDLSTSRMPSSA